MIRTHSRSARIGLLAILALLASFVLASPVGAQQETADVTINKVDAMTEGPVAGACFELWQAEATEAAYGPACTDETGSVLIEDVAHGDYTLKETTVPPGYAPVADQPLTVEGTVIEVTIANEPTTITVNKFDSETGDPLAGACFIVTNEDQEGGTFTSEEQCTDESGTTVFTHIEFGDYRVYETAPPPGYALHEEGFPVTLSGEAPDAEINVPNAAAEPTMSILFLQKLNCEGVDKAEIRMLQGDSTQEEYELISQYPGFQTCAFGEGTFEITGGDLDAPIVLHTDVFGQAYEELAPGTYQLRETAPNQAGPVTFVVEEGDQWGALVLNPMPAGQTPNVPAKPAVAVVPNTADSDVPGTPIALTMLLFVGLGVAGMTVLNVKARRS